MGMDLNSLLLHCNFTNDVKAENDEKFIKAIRNGSWNEILSDSIVSQLITGAEGSKNENESLQIVIALLFAFIQSNFTGPALEVDTSEFRNRSGLHDCDWRLELVVDGEDLNVNTKYPEFLVLAKRIFAGLKESDENKVQLKWWQMRITCIHQQVMDELCHSLYETFKQNAEWFVDHVQDLKNKELETLLMLEISMGYLLFLRIQKCEDWLEKIFKFLNVKLNVEGLLGVRTKYQQKPLPQLCLRVEGAENVDFPSAEVTNGKTKLPKLLKLDDEVRLERIQFSDPKNNEMMTIPSLIQCVVLAKLKHILRSQPKDRLSDEEVEPYITTLLYQEFGPLSVRNTTLLQNIHQESNNSRTVERSLKQCEEVLMFITQSEYGVPERLSYFFAALLPSIWSVRKQLGDLMLSLGLTKTALDVYLAIQSWEDVINCYNRLELRHKAAEIIQQELDKQPTATLYCLLGDATDSVECYEKAWEFSKHSSSRAQRHWGNFYYFKQNYEDAIPHLEKSLEINPLQESTLLRLAFAAINLEKWELAAQSYIRYTHLEPRGFESWNNLAKALIKLGDKHRAHKIMNEALKCNYNNWKVWENFLIISVDTGNFEDAINAYQRLIELKDKFLDLEVLEIVKNAITKNLPDAHGRPSKRLEKKMRSLLAHQCVQYGSEPKVWLYASFLAENELSRAQKLQKAYSAYVQSNQKWIDIKELRSKLLDICKDICLSSLNAVNDESISNMEKSAAMSQLSSARLSTRACIKAVENAGPNAIEDWEQCEIILNELKGYLESIQEKASSLS